VSKGDKANLIKQSVVKYYNNSDKPNAEKVKTVLDADFVLQKKAQKN
jgi:hypothetical protein